MEISELGTKDFAISGVDIDKSLQILSEKFVPENYTAYLLTLSSNISNHSSYSS